MFLYITLQINVIMLCIVIENKPDQLCNTEYTFLTIQQMMIV